MPTPTLGATVVYVERDAKAVLDFYQAAFGLSQRYYDAQLDFGELATGTAAHLMIASFAAGEFMLGSQFQRRASYVELALLTDDVPAAYAKAVAAGATPVSEPCTKPWGQIAAYVSSIEGTLIALLTPPPDASAS